MYIFLDTNVFYNNWQLKNADFNFLFNYVKNSGYTLLMSELVCEEIENIHFREMDAIINSLKNELKKTRKYNLTQIDFDFDKLQESYSFKNILKDKDVDVEYVPYENIRQSVVVKRALKKKRPFQEHEKGYRDTLIWLSLITYLKEKKIKKEVKFITNNKEDFYSGNKIEFHSDLKNDIEELGIMCKINPYNSLYNFIASHVNKDENRYSNSELQDKYLNSIDDILEEESEDFINQLSQYDFLEILSNNQLSTFPYLNVLLDHSFEIIEGVEDPEILTHKIISDNLIYISYRFNLRRCVLTFTISNSDYYLKQQEIDSSYYEIDTAKNETSFCSYVRTYLDVSFNYNMESETIDGFNIENIDFKQ